MIVKGGFVHVAFALIKRITIDGDIIKIKNRKMPFAVHVGIYYNRKKHRKII